MSDPHVPALFLNDFETGEPVIRGSVNLVGRPLPSGYTFVNAHDETSDLLPALVEAGIVSEPEHYVEAGYVQYPMCKILVGNPADF